MESQESTPDNLSVAHFPANSHETKSSGVSEKKMKHSGCSKILLKMKCINQC
jgi:hypothetical protein